MSLYIEYFGVLHLYCLQRASQTETLHWSFSPLLCTLWIRLISKRGLSGAHLDINCKVAENSDGSNASCSWDLGGGS